MANKKIIVSSGDGKYQEVPSTSFSVDGDKLIVKNMSVQTASFTGGTSGSIMQISGGILAPIWTTSSILAYSKDENDNFLTPADLSGTLFQYKTGMENYNGIGPHRIGSASFSGDVEGTISSSIRARVVSVANVNSGTLNSQFGGTGTGSFDLGSLVTLSGSGFKPANNADKVAMTDASGDWSMQDKSLLNFTPLTGAVVYLFTGSASSPSITSSIYSNWSPPQGTRFIRVICQGGGGGGGQGYYSATIAGDAFAASGGGGGGYADVIFNASSIVTPLIITVGGGGANAIGGGSSSFGSYIYSMGGAGGDSIAPIVNVAGGIGYILSGGLGGAGSGQGTKTPGGSISFNYGAPGGGGGGGGNLTVLQVGAVGGSLLNLAGGLGGSTNGGNGSPGNDGYSFYFEKYFLNGTSSGNIVTGNFPKLLCSGGGGGANAITTGKGGNGGSASFGAGGGGAGGGKGTTAAAYGFGGNGGKGYVLIICT